MFQSLVKSSICSQMIPTSDKPCNITCGKRDGIISGGKVDMIDDDALSSFSDDESITDMMAMMPINKSESGTIFVLPKEEENIKSDDQLVRLLK